MLCAMRQGRAYVELVLLKSYKSVAVASTMKSMNDSGIIEERI